MNPLVFAPATPADVAWLAPRLRAADRREVEAASGLDPAQALRAGLERSQEPLVAIEAGRPIAMFGVVPALPEALVGAPWMLGTDRVAARGLAVARASRPWLHRIGEGFRLLTNYVHHENELHIRWLSWLGAEFGERERWGAAGDYFWRFTIHCGRL